MESQAFRGVFHKHIDKNNPFTRAGAASPKTSQHERKGKKKKKRVRCWEWDRPSFGEKKLKISETTLILLWGDGRSEGSS